MSAHRSIHYHISLSFSILLMRYQQFVIEIVLTFTQLIIDSTAVDKYPRIYRVVIWLLITNRWMLLRDDQMPVIRYVTDGKTWSMNSLLYGRKLYYDRWLMKQNASRRTSNHRYIHRLTDHWLLEHESLDGHIPAVVFLWITIRGFIKRCQQIIWR